MILKNSNRFTVWEPMNGWLLLLPSRVSERLGTLYLPESQTKKSNQGICIKCSEADAPFFLGKECFFETHTEFKVEDTETKFHLFIIEANKVLMVREPTEEVARHSMLKTTGLEFNTTEHIVS